MNITFLSSGDSNPTPPWTTLIKLSPSLLQSNSSSNSYLCQYVHIAMDDVYIKGGVLRSELEGSAVYEMLNYIQQKLKFRSAHLQQFFDGDQTYFKNIFTVLGE